MDSNKKISMDEREFNCPFPVIHVKEAIEKASEGDVISVKVNDNVKKENIKRLCEKLACKYEIKENKADDIDLTITVSKVVENADIKDITCATSNDFVVVISSDKMGEGDEILGHNLMKAFLFALTKQDELPKNMIFYNRGAFLTTENSECLDTLFELEKAGVEIFTCGTCLDFYKLKENLKVGKITNMYDIVQMMENASKIIKP